MKALVTGATGFIGRNLISELLKRGEMVSAIVKPGKENSFPDEIEIIRADIRDPREIPPRIFRGVDVVFHTAGVTSSFRREEYMNTNFIGTKNLVEVMLESGQNPKFIYVSTLAAVGPSDDPDHVITEEELPHPVGLYGESKRKAEEYLIFMRNKVKSIILRPGVVYGALDRNLLPILRWSIKLAFPVISGSILSLVHISDLVKAILLAAEKETGSAEIFNISDGRRYSLDEIYEMLNQISVEQFSRKLKRVVIPREFIIALAHILKFVPPAVGESLGILAPDILILYGQRNWFCTYEKAEKHLGFTPSYVAKEGLKQAMMWYWIESTKE